MATTPAQDYAAEIAAAEATHTAEVNAANAAHTATAASATTALQLVVTNKNDPLVTQQHIADEVYLRTTTLGTETQGRTLAVSEEKRERTEADSLEKRDRKTDDLTQRSFSGVDLATTTAGTSLLGGRYGAYNLDAPVANGNSLEFAVNRIWRQLKHFQVDTTAFVNSQATGYAFPAIAAGGASISVNGGLFFDTQFHGTGSSGGNAQVISSGDFSTVGSALVSRTSAIQAATSATASYGLSYAVSHSSLSAPDKANALVAVNTLVSNINNYLYWGQPEGPFPVGETSVSIPASGQIKTGGETFSYTTTITMTIVIGSNGQTLSTTWYAEVALEGPLGTLTGTPTFRNWFATIGDKLKEVDCTIFAPGDFYFKGLTASDPAFDAGRLAYDGVNTFFIHVNGVVDSYLTVWYRVLDEVPYFNVDGGFGGDSTASSPSYPWQLAIAGGGGVIDALGAGALTGVLPYSMCPTTAVIGVSVGANQYIQFGVNAINGAQGTRLPSTNSADPTGKIYGGQIEIFAINLPVSQAPRAYAG